MDREVDPSLVSSEEVHTRMSLSPIPFSSLLNYPLVIRELQPVFDPAAFSEEAMANIIAHQFHAAPSLTDRMAFNESLLLNITTTEEQISRLQAHLARLKFCLRMSNGALAERLGQS